MMEFLKIVLILITRFSEKFGMDMAILCVVSIGFFKLFTNHLHTIDKKLDDLIKTTDNNKEDTNKKFSTLSRSLIAVKRTVSNIQVVCKERGDWLKRKGK